MKLKRVRTLPHVKLVGRLPGDLHEALVGYAEYYRAVHGESIDVWPLVVQMLRSSRPGGVAQVKPRRTRGRDRWSCGMGRPSVRPVPEHRPGVRRGRNVRGGPEDRRLARGRARGGAKTKRGRRMGLT